MSLVMHLPEAYLLRQVISNKYLQMNLHLLLLEVKGKKQLEGKKEKEGKRNGRRVKKRKDTERGKGRQAEENGEEVDKRKQLQKDT